MAEHQAVPGPGTRTLCEINCQLLSTLPGSARLGGHACPDIQLAGEHAGSLELPTLLVTVRPGHLPRRKLRGIQEEAGAGVVRSLLRQLLSPLPGVRSRLQAATGLQLVPGAAAPSGPLAWHARRPLLAAADAGGRVHVYDFGGQVPSLGQPPAASAPAPLAPAQVLQHEFQHGVAALAWRPNSGGCVAAACARGVALWRLGAAGKGPFGGGGGARLEGSRPGGGGGGAWMSWLRPSAGAGPLTCLAWHPRGHLLAAASAQGAGFFVWDVATGACTPLRAGTEPVSLLSWSPCGSYLLAAHPRGSFRVWQTHSWWPLKWSAVEGKGSAAGGIAGACWSPDSRTLLLAYAAAPQQLVTLHFTAEPPSLQAQLLPLSLPEIAGRANGSSRAAAVIEGVAWDPRGQRLAVAVGGTHPAAGYVALYDTRCDPILSARFIGYMRVEPLAAAAEQQQQRRGGARAPARAGPSSEIEEEAVEGAGAADMGAGEGELEGEREGVQLAFQPGFGQGALLAVRRGEFVATLPLYFS